MGRRIEWCRSVEELAGWKDRIGSGPLALDTEADSLHHYPEKVCLIQLSFEEVDLLVDPLAGRIRPCSRRCCWTPTCRNCFTEPTTT